MTSLKRVPAILMQLLLCSCILHALQSTIRFNQLSIEQGLSQSYAFAIIQDHKGFIWIGTEDGLNKYDGYQFIVYKPQIDNPNSLSHSTILCMLEDGDGTLWLGTEGKGLNTFNFSQGQFTRYGYNPADSTSISNERVSVLRKDKFGNIWIGTDNGLNRFDRENKRFVRYLSDPGNPHSLSNNWIQAICAGKSGTLWIGTNAGGLNAYDPERNTFISYKNIPGDSSSLSCNNVLSVCEDKSGILWIGTGGGGLNRFDPETKIFSCYLNNPDDPYSLSDNQINVVYEDRSEILWIGTDNKGVNLFDRERNRFFHYQNIPENPASLSNNRLLTIFEDNTGSLWFGTRGGGINRFIKKAQKFIHYKPDPSDPASLSYKMIWEIYEDAQGMIWIGTDGGGLNRFERQLNSFTVYKHDPKNRNSLSDNSIYSVFEDKKGILWIGTRLGGLVRYNRTKERFSHYRFDPYDSTSLSCDWVMGILEDRRGNFWIGTNGGGLNKFDRDREKFMRYAWDRTDSSHIWGKKIGSMIESRSGAIVIGTFGDGLNEYNPVAEAVTHYTFDTNNTQSISSDFIRSLCEDHTGTLWVGTISGLNRLDRQKKTFTKFTTENGLPDNMIYDILEDDAGCLWMSTNRGLSKFNPQTGEFKNYDEKDGLQSNEFNRGAACKSKSGELFFGGINGFNCFFPDSIKDNPHIPSVVITDFKIFNNPVPVGKTSTGRIILPKPISETDRIVLLHSDNVVSFEFAALNFVSPEKNQFAYMLQGFEKQWTYSGHRRFVTYTNLSPGTYTFKVKGSNNDGVWNKKGAALEIVILPPFWKTWWFYTLSSILFFTIAATILRYQIARIKKQKEEEERYRTISDVSQILEHGKATVYRRNFNSNEYEFIGKGIQDITGYSPQEFTLSLFQSIVISIELIGELSNYSLDEVFQLMRNGKIDNYVMDYSFRAKSGQIRWARDITTAIRDKTGRCSCCFGIAFDITDRKLVEQELAQKSMDMHNLLFEHTPDSILIFDKKTHKFLDCNETALRVYGYSIDELKTMTPFDLHPPEDFVKVHQNIDVKNVNTPNQYKHIAKSGEELDVEILSDETVYEGRPVWISMVRNITEHVQTEKMLKNLSDELSLKNRDMEDDLNMAREVQTALLAHNYPRSFPLNVPEENSALRFQHRYLPASTLAGDFFDIIPVSDHQVALFICDVMGHGTRASLMTFYLRGLIQELATSLQSPALFMNKLNYGLNSLMIRFFTHIYATAFYCVIDITTGEIRYTNAGHPTPVILRQSNDIVEMLHGSRDKIDPAIGIHQNYTFTENKYSLSNKDTVLFYTDGIYEVPGADGPMYGTKRLLSAINHLLHTPPQELFDRIIEDISAYSGGSDFKDDICMLTMEFNNRH